jgi:hypothetical protein
MVWIDTQFHETITNCVLTWKHASLAHFPDTLKLGMKQGLEGKTRVQRNSLKKNSGYIHLPNWMYPTEWNNWIWKMTPPECTDSPCQRHPSPHLGCPLPQKGGIFQPNLWKKLPKLWVYVPQLLLAQLISYNKSVPFFFLFFEVSNHQMPK